MTENNLDLATKLADEIEDFDLEENKICYEVWLVGDDENRRAVDFEYLIDGDYNDLNEAEKCFKYFNDLENIRSLTDLVIPEEVKYLYLRLECCEEDEDSNITCIEIYNEKEFNLKEEK